MSKIIIRKDRLSKTQFKEVLLEGKIVEIPVVTKFKMPPYNRAATKESMTKRKNRYFGPNTSALTDRKFKRRVKSKRVSFLLNELMGDFRIGSPIAFNDHFHRLIAVNKRTVRIKIPKKRFSSTARQYVVYYIIKNCWKQIFSDDLRLLLGTNLSVNWALDEVKKYLNEEKSVVEAQEKETYKFVLFNRHEFFPENDGELLNDVYGVNNGEKRFAITDAFRQMIGLIKNESESCITIYLSGSLPGFLFVLLSLYCLRPTKTKIVFVFYGPDLKQYEITFKMQEWKVITYIVMTFFKNARTCLSIRGVNLSTKNICIELMWRKFYMVPMPMADTPKTSEVYKEKHKVEVSGNKKFNLSDAYSSKEFDSWYEKKASGEEKKRLEQEVKALKESAEKQKDLEFNKIKVRLTDLQKEIKTAQSQKEQGKESIEPQRLQALKEYFTQIRPSDKREVISFEEANQKFGTQLNMRPDHEQLHVVRKQGTISLVISEKGKKLVEEDFKDFFENTHIGKDAKLAKDLAKEENANWKFDESKKIGGGQKDLESKPGVKKSKEDVSKKEKNEKTVSTEEFKLYEVPIATYGPIETSMTASDQVIDIMKDAKMKKVMDAIIDDEGKELFLKKRHFGVNLSEQNGLAYVINTIANDPKLKAEFNKRNFDRKAIKEKFPGYKSDKFINLNDRARVAKILNHAKREDLYTFASLMEARWTRSVRQYYNAKELVKDSAAINAGNVLAFLCDYNTDTRVGEATIDKKSKRQGDVGTIFGSQLHFELTRAINFLNAKGKKGENTVINNIMKYITIQDTTEREKSTTSDKMKNEIENLVQNPELCTKAKLAELVKTYPQFHPLFNAAVEKINGSRHTLAPDLFDTLTGKFNRIQESISPEKSYEKLAKEVEEKIAKDQKLQEAIRKHGIVKVRHTIVTAIMNVVDNAEFHTTDKSDTNLKKGWITKAFELQRAKNVLMQNLVKNFIVAGIHGDPRDGNGFRIDLGFARAGHTANPELDKQLKSDIKRNWNVGPGIKILDGKITGITVGIGGGLDFQYNLGKVVTARLDDVKSGKYIGLEAGAMADFRIKDRPTIEAQAGLKRSRDMLMGIRQLDRQYADVSYQLFTLETMPKSTQDLKNMLNAKYESMIKGSAKNDRVKEFLENNRKKISENIDFVVKVCEQFGVLKQATTLESLNSALLIAQQGNIEQRRHDTIAKLHGKVSLTELGFGITTSMFSTKATEQGKGAIAGVYAKMKLSTRRNQYVSFDKQVLMDQETINSGLTDSFDEKPEAKRDLQKYAEGLNAFFNGGDGLNVTTDKGKLVITGKNVDKLQVRASADAKKQVTREGDKLIIGDVKKLSAYTVSQAKGIQNILVLGTPDKDGKWMETLPANHTSTEVKEIETIKADRSKEEFSKQIVDDFKENDLKPPFDKAKKLEEAKKTINDFVDASGKFVLPASIDKTKVQDPQGLLDKKLPSTGTITIDKVKDGTWKIGYNAQPDGKLVMKYHIDKNDNPVAQERVVDEDAKAKVALSMNFTEAPQGLTDVKALFDKLDQQTQKEISTHARGNLPLWWKFTNATHNNYLKGYTNDKGQQRESAVSYLRQILRPFENAPQVKGIVQKLLDGTPEEKISICTRFKEIFAYNALRKYEGDKVTMGTTLEAEMNRREAASTGKANFMKMFGWEWFEAYRDLFKESAKAKSNTLQLEKKAGLVGFTAFYRPSGEYFGMSLTQPGETRVAKDFFKDIDPKDGDKAREYFIKKFEGNGSDAHKENQKALLKTLNSQLKKQAEAQGLKAGGDLSFDDFKNLLEGKPLKLGGGKEQRYDISLTPNFVFYLLGECANESIGLDLSRGLTLQKYKKKAGEPEPEQNYEGDGNMQGSNAAKLDVGTRALSVGSQVQSTEYKVGYRHDMTPSKTPKTGGTSHQWGSDAPPGGDNVHNVNDGV